MIRAVAPDQLTITGDAAATVGVYADVPSVCQAVACCHP